MDSTAHALLATGVMASIGVGALAFLLSRWERQQGETPSCAPTPTTPTLPIPEPAPAPITRMEPVEIDGFAVCVWRTQEEIMALSWAHVIWN